MLARGTRRVVVAILENGSCGEGGTNTAAAIHKDMGVVSLLVEEVGAGKMVVVYGMAGRGSSTTRRVMAVDPKLRNDLRGTHNRGALTKYVQRVCTQKEKLLTAQREFSRRHRHTES
jgi:hypothetical protein